MICTVCNEDHDADMFGCGDAFIDDRCAAIEANAGGPVCYSCLESACQCTQCGTFLTKDETHISEAGEPFCDEGCEIECKAERDDWEDEKSFLRWAMR